MDDNCGTCPKCGGELKISPNPKLLYECSDYECDYREYMWPNPPKGGKAKGGKKMDAREKWEFLVDCYNKNKDAQEQRIQVDWENLFVEIFGYSKLLKEVDSQRSIQIGSTQRTVLDIIIRQENRKLFVVELKRYTLTTGTEQLFSYLKLLKVDLGVLICNKIYLYDYDITKDDDKQAFVEIAFTKDNPDGIKFVELFSKASFDRQHIKNFIQERKQEKENIHAIQQKVTTEFVRQVLQEQLSETYSQEEIQQALEGIVITVDKKVAIHPTPFIPSSTQRQSTPPIPIEGDPYPTMKIGKIANEILRERLSQGISEQELIHLQKAEYSKKCLGINYPLLAKNRYVDDKNGIPHSRYYVEQVIINGSYFYLCSEWYESSANNDRPYLLKWLQDH